MRNLRLQDRPFVTTLTEKNDAKHFYRDLLEDLSRSGLLKKDMRVLVVCGTTKDKEVFNELGFTDVTISNLDTHISADGLSPYTWSYQDVENLDYPDAHFDFVVENAGLHHCREPHHALLEMYRVAKYGVLVIEARDSSLMKLALRLGLAEEYEICAVVMGGLECGGIRNTPIPNHIYRWTEAEVRKTLASYAPHAKPDIRYYYDFKFPFTTLLDRPQAYLATALVLYPFAKLAGKIFRKQSNLFAFAIRKPRLPDELAPWLKIEENNIALNLPWIEERYSVEQNKSMHALACEVQKTLE